jgi:outer membrane protein TolC
MLSVMVSVDLPWQTARRQDRDIASRLAEAEQVQAMSEDARRMHEAEVRGWLTDFENAQRRVERYERILVALARSRAEAALAAYRGGRGELGEVLEADRARTENDLGHIQALTARARAWAKLHFMNPQRVEP